MMNQIMLVGRLAKKPMEGDQYITLTIPRSFKNSEGIYECDIIDIMVRELGLNTIMEHCKQGDIIGVRGRIQSRNIDDGDGHYTRKIEIIGDKISFLSSHKVNGGE